MRRNFVALRQSGGQLPVIVRYKTALNQQIPKQLLFFFVCQFANSCSVSDDLLYAPHIARISPRSNGSLHGWHLRRHALGYSGDGAGTLRGQIAAPGD